MLFEEKYSIIFIKFDLDCKFLEIVVLFERGEVLLNFFANNECLFCLSFVY